MTPAERRASVSLAGIFGLRMLGLFLVLPVFALEAAKYPGGDDAVLVGIAMGIYGLTQGLLQIPVGMASDRFGRKRVIAAGLVVFALGSFIAALAHSLAWLLAGRALQGAGAISAAVTALLADQTRDSVRTRAMALVGASIGLTFALSLVAGPVLAAHIGLGGLFAITGVLAAAAIAALAWWTPPEPAAHPSTSAGQSVLSRASIPRPERSPPRGRLAEVLRDGQFRRLMFGVFVLHVVQLAMWIAIPAMLVRAGLAADAHWRLYLPAVLASFLVMGVTLFPLERRGYLRAVFLVSVGLLALVQLSLLLQAGGTPVLTVLALLLFLFFCAFNVLEASLPSIASRLAPPHARGTALGVYNTLQSLGFFAGGVVGGWLARDVGFQGLFAACAAAVLLWLVVAWPMRAPRAPRSPEQVLADDAGAA